MAIPKWLAGFATEPLFFYRHVGKTPTHTATSKYCKVTTVKPDVEYLLGFEDLDEEMQKLGYPHAPDWDFDEPLLRVTRFNNRLLVQVEKYGGSGISRVKYFDKVLWDTVGGLLGVKVGATKTIEIPTEAVPVAPAPTPIVKMGAGPFLFLGLLGAGLIYALVKKIKG